LSSVCYRARLETKRLDWRSRLQFRNVEFDSRSSAVDKVRSISENDVARRGGPILEMCYETNGDDEVMVVTAETIECGR